MAQVVKSVNEQQILGNVELNHKLTALTEQIKNLTPQSEQYEFAGLSELAQAFTEQQFEVNLVKGLALLGQQIQVVDGDIAHSRESASTLIYELRPEIENLALAINYWQFETEIKQAISEVSEVIQQLEQRHTFDFGDLPHLLNEVTTEQLLTQEGLDVRLTSLTQQLANLTIKAPTRFEDMNALVDDLQLVQAKSQLLETGLIARVNVIAELVADFHPNADQYKFEGREALYELALAIGASNIEQQLENGGLLEQVQQTTSRAISAISQHIEQLKEDLSVLQTINKTKSFIKLSTEVSTHKTEVVATLAQQLREIPLDEIANRLGLVLDKHDKHKWWGEGQIVSINGQKFYDHLNLKGGYGAIDLVMHVQRSDFKEALQWLTDGISELPRVPVRSHEPKAKERQPFQSPTPDESKWLAVRQYLIEKRQLPAALVDALYSQGKVYADCKQNAVFVRQDAEDNITGASLRGTYDGSSFKGLATGSRRDAGWFSFVQGEGLLKRIVLVESSIDAISAAAIATQSGATRFIATDGAGALPIKFLQLHQGAGIQIIAAHDCDRAGEEMAWRLAAEIKSVVRAIPTLGKDWNEQLKGIESPLDSSQWKLVARAIGQPESYISRIKEVVSSGQSLPKGALAAMRQDFNTYRQISSELWQWHQVAKDIEQPKAYLQRIAEVAIAFHHPQVPVPLSESALLAMQQATNSHNQNHYTSRSQSEIKRRLG